MSRNWFLLLLGYISLMTACTGPIPTPVSSPLAVTPLPTAPSPSPPPPTATPTAPVRPAPSLTATPAAESRWQCDASGGVACFSNLYYVTMLNAEEGWAVGEKGMVLRYTKASGETSPAWRQVPPSEAVSFRSLSMVSTSEGWGLGAGYVAHLTQGESWERIPLPRGDILYDLAMVDENEGWIVGDKGRILHYVNGEWLEFPKSTDRRLFAIDMVNSEEGWAVGIEDTILHYHNQQWEPAPVDSSGIFFMDIEMVNEGVC